MTALSQPPSQGAGGLPPHHDATGGTGGSAGEPQAEEEKEPSGEEPPEAESLSDLDSQSAAMEYDGSESEDSEGFPVEEPMSSPNTSSIGEAQRRLFRRRYCYECHISASTAGSFQDRRKTKKSRYMCPFGVLVEEIVPRSSVYLMSVFTAHNHDVSGGAIVYHGKANIARKFEGIWLNFNYPLVQSQCFSGGNGLLPSYVCFHKSWFHH